MQEVFTLKFILGKLSDLLGPIVTISKDGRELKDNALRAISIALNETYSYYRKRENGMLRDIDLESALSKYWDAAAISIRHIDQELATACENKSKYWLNPDEWSNEDIEAAGIQLESLAHAYHKLAKYGKTYHPNGSKFRL